MGRAGSDRDGRANRGRWPMTTVTTTETAAAVAWGRRRPCPGVTDFRRRSRARRAGLACQWPGRPINRERPRTAAGPTIMISLSDCGPAGRGRSCRPPARAGRTESRFTPKCKCSMLHFVLAWNFCVIVNMVSAGSQDQIIRCRKLRGGFDDDEKVFLAGVSNPGHEL
jgi:hypothetical protein